MKGMVMSKNRMFLCVFIIKLLLFHAKARKILSFLLKHRDIHPIGSALLRDHCSNNGQITVEVIMKGPKDIWHDFDRHRSRSLRTPTAICSWHSHINALQ
jgi:hypothetical protein